MNYKFDILIYINIFIFSSMLYQIIIHYPP